MKQFINWNEKYNTGNFVIDHQHRRLVQLINNLEEVLSHDELHPTLLNVIFEEVTNYTVYHFQTEEELMENVNYSGMDDHIILHKAFIEGLAQFKIQVDNGKAYIDIGLCQYLKDWLLGHIVVEDPKIIQEMSSGQGAV